MDNTLFTGKLVRLAAQDPEIQDPASFSLSMVKQFLAQVLHEDRGERRGV